MANLSPELKALVDALLVARPASLTLDEIADAIGTRVAGYTEIDTLIDALEEAGVRVRSPEASDLPRELAQVLAAARELGATRGKLPSVEDLAGATGLEAAAVRRALLYARVLSR